MAGDGEGECGGVVGVAEEFDFDADFPVIAGVHRDAPFAGGGIFCGIEGDFG